MKRISIYIISIGLLFLGLAYSSIADAQQTKPSDKEWKKLGDVIAKERKELRQESCKDCSYMMYAKIFLSKEFKADSILLSYSAPTTLQRLSNKLVNADINWKSLTDKAGKKRIIILPIWYLNERPGGSVLFASVTDFSQGLFQFSDGNLELYKDAYHWLAPMAIYTTSAQTEGKMILDSSQLIKFPEPGQISPNNRSIKLKIKSNGINLI
ncbi:hypothetical protein ECE50_018435 [Chitinophaga sp. Mgbs1]|uniref:Uncharacterized protein n=1 Tax=Chitinophaga solisilvae TaxID=1233460 RepID=A0A9Q5DD05_9BACT|nr:hypothetical protein [Chitinophaga solisilvae]